MLVPFVSVLFSVLFGGEPGALLNTRQERHFNCFRVPPTLRPRRLSARGSGFLLSKNGADQPRLSNVVQLSRALPRVENGNKY